MADFDWGSTAQVRRFVGGEIRARGFAGIRTPAHHDA
jgi:hypothetical protein